MNPTYQLAVLDEILRRAELERRAQVATFALASLKEQSLRAAETPSLRAEDAAWLRALAADIT